MQGASLLAAVALSLGAWAMGPAEMGASLAEIVALLSPVARYHQALALASLLGGAPPDPGPARVALDETSRTLEAFLEARAFEPDWPNTKAAVQELQGTVLAVSAGLSQPDVRQRLGDLWAALERVGAEATAEARGLGVEWTFQAALLAAAVLVAPSPLYLQVPKELREYLTTATPPWISLEAATGLATVLALSNRALSADEEILAREAARTLLADLLDQERREGGGTEVPPRGEEQEARKRFSTARRTDSNGGQLGLEPPLGRHHALDPRPCLELTLLARGLSGRTGSTWEWRMCPPARTAAQSGTRTIRQ